MMMVQQEDVTRHKILKHLFYTSSHRSPICDSLFTKIVQELRLWKRATNTDSRQWNQWNKCNVLLTGSQNTAYINRCARISEDFKYFGKNIFCNANTCSYLRIIYLRRDGWVLVKTLRTRTVPQNPWTRFRRSHPAPRSCLCATE